MNAQQIAQEKTFSVGEYPTVTVQNCAGNISVYPGIGGVVGIRVTIEPDRFGDIPTIDMQCPDGNNVMVKVHYPVGSIGSMANVHFAITVPSTVDLNLHTSAGRIDVDNVHGQLALQSNAGTITATQTTLTGNASFQTNAGSITFAGIIDPHATYCFQSNAGSVRLLLPEQSAIHVNAKTDIGSLHIDFPTLYTQHHFLGKEAYGDIGEAPRAQLSLRSNVGSISLLRGVEA